MKKRFMAMVLEFVVVVSVMGFTVSRESVE